MTEREQQGLMRLRVELYTAAQTLDGDALVEFTTLIREIAMVLEIVPLSFARGVQAQKNLDEVLGCVVDRPGMRAQHAFEPGAPRCDCGLMAHATIVPGLFDFPEPVSAATAEGPSHREAPSRCSRCDVELMFSARARSDGLCGPCSRRESGTQTPGDQLRERWKA